MQTLTRAAAAAAAQALGQRTHAQAYSDFQPTEQALQEVSQAACMPALKPCRWRCAGPGQLARARDIL